MTVTLSVFIIARNESGKIGRCIERVKDWADEIIVVNGLSEDNTAEEARAAGALVYDHAFHGFTDQKNFALSKVTSDWALNVDADEYPSDELKTEIRRVIEQTPLAGFEIPFSNWFLGAQMKHSGLNGERHLRLTRTAGAKYVGGLVHEKLEAPGKTGLLQNPIEHHSYDSVTTYFRKFNHYTTLGANQLYKNGKKAGLLTAFGHIPLDFLKRYVFKLGFLDGLRGLAWATFSSYYGFTKYLKLWQLNRRGE